MASFAMVRGNEPRVYQVETGSGKGSKEEPFPLAEPYRWVACPKSTTEFHTFDGTGGFAPPAAFFAPPPDISDRQFGEGLWRDGLIDFDAYLAFIGPGTVPSPLLAIIDTLPDDDTGGPTPRKLALGLVTGAQTYQFDNPLVDLVRQKQDWTVEHLRERWAAWAEL